MSVKASILSDSDLAKATVMSSPLDDDTKRSLVTLLTQSAQATNGITPEEKIQSLTESMCGLATSLAIYMSKADQRLTQIEAEYKSEHPTDHTDKMKKYEQNLHDVEEYRNLNGIVPNIRIKGTGLADHIDECKDAKDDKFIDRLFELFHRPYIWIFGCVAVCSPYANDVIGTLIKTFCK